MTHESPRSHVQLLERGDDDGSLSRILDEFREPLLRRVRLMMGPRARRQAESVDFLQEVFRAAVDNVDQVRCLDAEGFLRWLTATARNRIRSSVRARRERALESMSVSLGAIRGAEESHTPLRSVAKGERVAQLVQAVERLAEDHRRVIELRDFEGRSFRDIGVEFGRTEAAAQMLHTRAIVRLGAELRKVGAGPSTML